MRGVAAPLNFRTPIRRLDWSAPAIWLTVVAVAALATISLAASAEGRTLSGHLGAHEATGAVSPASRSGVFGAERRGPKRRALVETMREGGGVRPPYGYERFCALDRDYCAPPQRRRPGAIVPATTELIEQLDAFNRGVNAEYQPHQDMAVYGVSDHWTFPTVFADCEDYVLEKQARLIRAGWPREALLIGVVVGEESPFHAVLIVRTSMGEFVLDNMTDELRDWRDTGYTWVIRQSTDAPERWVRVLQDPPRG